MVTVASIVSADQFGGFNSNANVFMNLTQAQTLSHNAGNVNTVFVSIEPKGSDAFAYSGQVRNDIKGSIADLMPGSGMDIQLDKKQMLDDGRASLSQFTAMFFVLGSFSVIAGLLLIVNIFTMLGEERKSEMGMSRAIGMKKTHLRKLFVYEGLVYACVAAGIGMIIGVLMADVIILGISGMPMFGDVNLSSYFTFTFASLAISFAAGFSITMVTVYFVTRRISNLNIVRAIRNIPEPAVKKEDKKAFRMGLAHLRHRSGPDAAGDGWQKPGTGGRGAVDHRDLVRSGASPIPSAIARPGSSPAWRSCSFGCRRGTSRYSTTRPASRC